MEVATSAHSPEARVAQQLAQIRSESRKADWILQLQQENAKLTEQVNKLEKRNQKFENENYYILYGYRQ